MTIEEFQQFFLIYSMTLPRLFGCFIMLPILSKQMLGSALLRNGVLCSLAIYLYPVVSEQAHPSSVDGIMLVLLLAKEILLGLLISFIAAIPFWAIEATGFLSTTNVAPHWRAHSILLLAINPLQQGFCSPKH